MDRAVYDISLCSAAYVAQHAPDAPRCSFCDQPAHMGRSLAGVEGRPARICNECLRFFSGFARNP